MKRIRTPEVTRIGPACLWPLLTLSLGLGLGCQRDGDVDFVAPRTLTIGRAADSSRVGAPVQHAPVEATSLAPTPYAEDLVLQPVETPPAAPAEAAPQAAGALAPDNGVILTAHTRPDAPAPVREQAMPSVPAPLVERVLQATPPELVQGPVPLASTNGPPPEPCHGHAPDYRWLTGELQYVDVRAAWCLHYASADDEDAHGGTVTLVSVPKRAGLHSGQRVRIEGRLLDPASLQPSPAYVVRALSPLP